MATEFKLSYTGSEINEILRKANQFAVQSDWNQTDETAPDYIKNKQEIVNSVLAAMPTWTGGEY